MGKFFYPRERPGTIFDVTAPPKVQARPETLWPNSKTGQHILEIQDSTQLDTLQRREREEWGAAARDMEKEWDAEKRKARFKQYLDNVNQWRDTSRSPTVNRVFGQHLDNATLQRQEQYSDLDQKLTVARVKDEYETNYEATYWEDNPEEFGRLTQKAVDNTLMTPEAQAKLVADFPTQVAIRKIKKLMDAGDPASLEEAVRIGESLIGIRSDKIHQEIDAARTDLRQIVTHMTKAAAAQRKDAVNGILSEMDFHIVEAKKIQNRAQRIEALEALRTELRDMAADLSPEDARVMNNRIDDALEGRAVKTNVVVGGQILKDIYSLNESSTPEERGRVLDQIRTASINEMISDEDRLRWEKEVETGRKNAESQTINRAIEMAKAARVENLPAFEKALVDKIRADKLTDPKEIYKTASSLINIAPKEPEKERAISPRDIALGRLAAGKYMTGVLGEFRRIDTRQLALEQALVTLGLGWDDPKSTEYEPRGFEVLNTLRAKRLAEIQASAATPEAKKAQIAEWGDPWPVPEREYPIIEVTEPPPMELRRFGQVYSFMGRKARWTGTGWEPVP